MKKCQKYDYNVFELTKNSLWGQAPSCILPSWVMSSLSTFSLFAAILLDFRLKTVTLQALLSKSYTDKRVLTRKQTTLRLPTNYEKGAFKPKIAQK